MMRSARILLCGVAAVALLGPARSLPLYGQNPQNPQTGSQPQTTFRATTSLVEVDAIVLDKDKNFVPGLVAEDLMLFEDGKPQTIQQFYMVTHDSSAHNPVAGAGVNGAQSAEDRAHRVFVLLFDEGSLGNESLMRVKKGAEQFIQGQIGPGDIGGVFVAGDMYRSRLTTDKNELLMAVRSARPNFDNRQSLLAPLREFPRIPSEVDAARIESGEREVAAQLAERACVDEPALCAETAPSRDTQLARSRT